MSDKGTYVGQDGRTYHQSYNEWSDVLSVGWDDLRGDVTEDTPSGIVVWYHMPERIPARIEVLDWERRSRGEAMSIQVDADPPFAVPVRATGGAMPMKVVADCLWATTREGRKARSHLMWPVASRAAGREVIDSLIRSITTATTFARLPGNGEIQASIIRVEDLRQASFRLVARDNGDAEDIFAAPTASKAIK